MHSTEDIKVDFEFNNQCSLFLDLFKNNSIETVSLLISVMRTQYMKNGFKNYITKKFMAAEDLNQQRR